jgi:hypothetical protein
MEPIKWIDRKFSFGYSIGYAPLFIERLKGIAPRLEEMMSTCNDVKASERVDNTWSIKENIGHLSDLESLHDGRIDDFIAKLPELRAADMSNKETEGANHNEQPVQQLLSTFRNKRSKFIERIAALDEVYFESTALHPRLQQVITFTDLLFFIAEHDNHHLTRIAALI